MTDDSETKSILPSDGSSVPQEPASFQLDPGDRVGEDVLSALTTADRAALTPYYTVEQQIGRGGMGVVFRARHLALERPVALKVCLPGADAARFRKEAKLLARISSPRVVRVFDFDLLPSGRPVMAMEWVDGQDLGKVIEEASGPLPQSQVLPWMHQVAEGMRALAHEDIVHRDLKPSNILIDSAGEARVTDFGLARSPEVDPMTLSGTILGSPHYMAPEQVDYANDVDTRADIYAFGATFYHALTGQLPFDGPTMLSILIKHQNEPLVAPQAVNPDIDDRIAECIERCLAKAPHERFDSFDHLLDAMTVEASPWEYDNDPILESFVQRYRARRHIYFAGDADAMREPDIFRFPRDRQITIAFADIVDQPVEALVSSDDHQLTMGGGVSGGICRSAGHAYAQIVRQFAPVRHGRVVVTPAGNLPARFVFHGVTIGREDGQRVRPSRDIILEIMESCFYHADSLNVTSIAFPLLGSGAGRLSAEICLDTMFRFLARRFLRGVSVVASVRIVIHPLARLR